MPTTSGGASPEDASVGAADVAKNTSSTPPAAFLARSDRVPSDAFSDLDFGSEDLNALARVIARDVYVGSPDVRWGDVAGLAGRIGLIGRVGLVGWCGLDGPDAVTCDQN